MRRHLPVPLIAAAALAGCSGDAEPSDEATMAAPQVPATCARISATDLSAVIGEDLTIQDVSEESGIEGGTVCAAVGTVVIVNWVVEPEAPEAPSDAVSETSIRVSAQGDAPDGRTTTATVVRTLVPDGPDIATATLRKGAEAVVAAYAQPAPPAPEGDQCHVLSDADVSALAGFPVEVRDQEESGDDLDCTTVVGDAEGQDGLATLKWSLTPPRQTLTAAAGSGYRPTEPLTLPGGEPAVISYDGGSAVVAAQAGARTIVVEVSSLVDEDEFSQARVRELAGDIADAYAG